VNGALSVLVPSMLALVVASCGAGSGGDGPDRFAAGGDALCAATVEADTDTSEARRLFFDGAHQPLHELADETAERDRTVAARLLRAKQAVESDFETDTAHVASALAELTDATDEALRVLDRPGLNCEQSQ
jgi:hypothetical protein